MKIPLNFFLQQLSSAVKSCQQLLTADKNENQPRELKFGTGISFRRSMKIPSKKNLWQLSSAVNSCQKLLTTDENGDQPRELKFCTGISFRGRWRSHQKNCDSFHQLATAVKSFWQLMKMKINLESWNFAQVSALGGWWKFHLNFVCDSCN